jgi:hypothetical protein
VSWSDFGAATHTIATPSSNASYTAYYEPVTSNVVTNGGFDEPGNAWLAGLWNWVVRAPASATFSRETTSYETGPVAMRADLANNATDWYVQVLHPNVPLTAATNYTLSFAAKATDARAIRVSLHQATGSYTTYLDRSVSIGTAWQTYSVTFTATTTDPAALLAFNLGGAPGSVWIDSVSLVTSP